MKKSTFFKLMSFWPPFLGAGIRVKHVSEDFREVIVETKLRFWNQNYVKTQYGGTMSSMTDPFYMLMILDALGKNYIVWDKAATIRFRKPGTSTIRAHFKLEQSMVEHIKAKLETQEKIDIDFNIDITDVEGNTVAEVCRVVHIRKKPIKTQ